MILYGEQVFYEVALLRTILLWRCTASDHTSCLRLLPEDRICWFNRFLCLLFPDSAFSTYLLVWLSL